MKYKEAMDHLKVTDAMKENIVSNLKYGVSARKGRNWMKIALGAAAISIAACVIIPSAGYMLGTASYKLSNTAAVSTDSVPMESVKEEAGLDTGGELDAAMEANTSETVLQDNAKRVYRAYTDVETRDFAKTTADIKELCSKYDGFIASESFNRMSNDLRYGNMELRIPTKNFDSFLKELNEQETVTSSNKSVENITQNYYDTKGRIESLEKERERLNELITKAESVSDLIAIQAQLSDVEGQLQSWQQDLSSMDLDLDYSTIDLSVREVEVYTNTSSSSWNQIPQAIGDTFYYFFNGLGEIVVLLIMLAPWVLLIGLVVFIWKFWKKRKLEKMNQIFKDSDDTNKTKNSHYE